MVSLNQSQLSQKEIRQRTPWLFLVLLVLNFALMAYDARDNETKERAVRVWATAAAGFIQRPVSSVTNTGAGFFGAIANMRTAAVENESLRHRVNALESEAIRSRDLAAENERLRGLLTFQQTQPYQIVPAEIIGRDPSAWFNMVMINRGSNAGIDLNMPVVTGEGVVGRVVATSPFTAQVMLLTEERSSVSAIIGQVGESNALGLVKSAGGKDLLEMRYVPGQEKIDVGNIVTTTGQDRIYPAGLKIGEVTEVKTGSAASPHTIFVRPTARLSSLQDVAVLLYRPPARPEPDKALPNVKKQGDNKRKNP